jgi:hypothetical protein
MADYTEDELYAKLERADAAGDTEAAKAIADEIRRVQGAAKKTPAANDSDIARLVSGQQAKPWDYNPTNMHALDGVTRQVGAGLDAVQHHALGAVHGAAQLIENGLPLVLPVNSGAYQWAQQNAQQTNQALAQRERDYQARTGDTAASYAGGAIGEVLPWMYGVGEAKALGILPKLKPVSQVSGLLGKAGNVAAKTGLLAGEGAAYGAVQPVTDGDYGRAKLEQVVQGAITNPLMMGGLKAGVGAARGVAGAARYLTPTGREAIASERFGKMLAGDPQAVAALNGMQQFVPGEAPSVAQVLTHDPKYLQMERALRNNQHAGPAFVAQDATNDAARMDVLRNLAGTDDAMQAAIDARRGNARAYRDANLPETGSALVDPQGIMGTLSKLALDGDPTVAGAARRHLNLLSQHADANGGKVPAWALDNIHQNVGETLGSMKTNGPVTSKQVARYAPVKAQIVDALDGAVPGYRDYLAAYARDSAPINDMEAARGVLAGSDRAGLNGAGGQVVTLPQLLRTLRVNDRADFPMSPQAEA